MNILPAEKGTYVLVYNDDKKCVVRHPVIGWSISQDSGNYIRGVELNSALPVIFRAEEIGDLGKRFAIKYPNGTLIGDDGTVYAKILNTGEEQLWIDMVFS